MCEHSAPVLPRISRTLVAGILILASGILIADSLPPTPSYLGEIKRNEQGQIIAAPIRQESVRVLDQTSAEPPPEIQTHLSSKYSVSKESNRKAGPAPATQAESQTEKLSLTPRLIRVGSKQQVQRVAVASKIARDGDTIEIEGGDYFGDVAVWTQDRLTIRGVNGRPRLFAAGADAEGKGIWVIRGGTVKVENIEFVGAKVPDRNGAGIRFEKGDLQVTGCLFRGNENGILTASGDQSLSVLNSEFENNGAGDGRSHGIYAGAIRKLNVEGSYFHHGKAGHLIKSRAQESHILYNRITDELGGTSSYELEFPNGGFAIVLGNIIQQSSQSQNSTVISYGAEGYKWPQNELYLINNTLADDYPNSGVFLRVAPGAALVKSINNLLLGKGNFEGGAAPSLAHKAKAFAKRIINGNDKTVTAPDTARDFRNNVNVDFDVFAQAPRFDYRIWQGALKSYRFVKPGSARGFDLAPAHEYQHPASTRPLGKYPELPGALQTEVFNQRVE